MDKDKVKGSATYIQRVLQDDFVQDQLRTMVTELRSTFRRAKQERGRSVEDKKLYGNVRQVAISARNVARAFTHPEPEPTHRGRRLAVIVLAIAGAAALTAKLQKLETERKQAAHASSPPSPGGQAAPRESVPASGVVAGSTA
jgi:hypothetical protein